MHTNTHERSQLQQTFGRLSMGIRPYYHAAQSIDTDDDDDNEKSRPKWVITGREKKRRKRLYAEASNLADFCDPTQHRSHTLTYKHYARLRWRPFLCARVCLYINSFMLACVCVQKPPTIRALHTHTHTAAVTLPTPPTEMWKHFHRDALFIEHTRSAPRFSLRTKDVARTDSIEQRIVS